MYKHKTFTHLHTHKHTSFIPFEASGSWTSGTWNFKQMLLEQTLLFYTSASKKEAWSMWTEGGLHSIHWAETGLNNPQRGTFPGLHSDWRMPVPLKPWKTAHCLHWRNIVLLHHTISSLRKLEISNVLAYDLYCFSHSGEAPSWKSIIIWLSQLPVRKT